jgi:hypothetical protein
MSGWKDGFVDEGFPWCHEPLPCTPDMKYCVICAEVVRQMDFMEGAIKAEKKRHDVTFDKLEALKLQVRDLKTALRKIGYAEFTEHDKGCERHMGTAYCACDARIAVDALGPNGRTLGEGPTDRPCCVEAYARGHAVGLAHRDTEKRVHARGTCGAPIEGGQCAFYPPCPDHS